MVSATEDRELQDLLVSEAYEFLTQCGINIVKATIQDIPRIQEAIIKHYCIFSCKTELDEIIRGLDSLGVGNLLKKHPREFLPLFNSQTKPLTPGLLQDLVSLDLSPRGSNAREMEEEGAMNWVTFLSEFEAESTISVFEEGISTTSASFSITLADILNFITGSTEVPPMGFSPAPSICFSTGTAFPLASTCSNCLTLPLGLPYDVFRYNVSFGIKNSPGFHRI